MKKWMVLLTIVMMIGTLFSTSTPAHADQHLSVSARNAVLMDMKSGRVLYEKAADDQHLIASTTKIMTALLAIESGMLKEKVKASHRAVYTEGSSIYLKEGEKMTLEDLVYGLMLRSGNDAAIAIAEHVGGSVEGFAYLMNEKAAWLGMNNSNFDNPHGLDSDTHYSTAYDLALLMSYSMKNDTFREVTGAERYLSDNRDYYWFNKNKMLTRYYDFCTGGKTGYTKAAGRTLVTSAKKGDMELVAVTLSASDDWNDHQRMFEYGFDHYDTVTLQKEGKVTFQSVEDDTFYYPRDIQFPVTEKEKYAIQSSIQLYRDFGDDLFAGKTIYYLDDEPILETALLSEPLETGLLGLWRSVTNKLIGAGTW
ncbi:D-alanyl-D-alanine carboxypeptidase family protein [Thalassobacillus hwangdonensis]|uniref:D-alanyl-D-alanine carboxypeptidase family protein n=1 Tax=Thalassobacillus hwangdonensis TaxID=546108 RepID=A0ABW3KYC2_9BACI